MERCGGPIFPDSGFKEIYNEIYIKKSDEEKDDDLKNFESSEARKGDYGDAKQDKDEEKDKDLEQSPKRR